MITWHIEQALFNDFKVIYLVNITIEFLHEIRIKLNSEVSLHIVMENKL